MLRIVDLIEKVLALGADRHCSRVYVLTKHFLPHGTFERGNAGLQPNSPNVLTFAPTDQIQPAFGKVERRLS